jgi:hypothetical protein
MFDRKHITDSMINLGITNCVTQFFQEYLFQKAMESLSEEQLE